MGGGVGVAAVPTGPVEPDKSSLWKDLFDCSDLQLFAIFMAEKLVAPRCVQIVSKGSKTPITIFLTTPVGSVSCERSSLSTLRRLKLWKRSSMTKEGLSCIAMVLIHRGTNCMPTPKDNYERKSN